LTVGFKYIAMALILMKSVAVLAAVDQKQLIWKYRWRNS